MRCKKIFLCLSVALLSITLSAAPVFATESAPETALEPSESLVELEIAPERHKTMTKVYDSWLIAREEPESIEYSEVDETTGIRYAGTLEVTSGRRLVMGQPECSLTYEGTLTPTSAPEERVYRKTVTKVYDSWLIAREEPESIEYSEVDETTGIRYAGTLEVTSGRRLVMGQPECSLTYEGTLTRAD